MIFYRRPGKLVLRTYFCHIYAILLVFNQWDIMNTQVSIMPKHTILIVDDEVSIRDMLSIALDAAGYNVLQAENAQIAHSLVIDRHPDLILLDWMMPGTTGLELLRRLKRDESTEKTPVIMLTAKTQETNKISGLDAGADDYIAKPFSPRELISRVKEESVGKTSKNRLLSVILCLIHLGIESVLAATILTLGLQSIDCYNSF
jgi:CheY-like chemotaxis protein